MDNAIVQNFARMQMLQNSDVPQINSNECLQLNPVSDHNSKESAMDDLSFDLNSALDETNKTHSSLSMNENLLNGDLERDADGDIDGYDTPALVGTVKRTGNQNSSRRRAWKKRCKSTSNLVNLTNTSIGKQTEVLSSSSEDEDNESGNRRDKGTKDNFTSASFHISDSDEMLPPPTLKYSSKTTSSKVQYVRKNKSSSDQGLQNKNLPLESDMITGNFSTTIRPTSTKRKRKFKRMALDPSSASNMESSDLQNFGACAKPEPPTSHQNIVSMKRTKVKSVQGFSKQQQLQGGIVIGKRKRNNREKSVEPEALVHSSSRHQYLAYRTQSLMGMKSNPMDEDDDDMEMDDDSDGSSSISSTDWEDQDSDRQESFNNGLEADDEQSDWPGAEFEEEIDYNYGKIDNLTPLTATARQAYMARMKRLAECVPGREIRAGARKLRNQAGFIIKSSSSEQLSRFLQDPSRSELKLTVMRTLDRNKIMHLANLYSLSVRNEGTNMLILSKTGKTLRLKEFAVPKTANNPIEFKRRRRTPPNSPLLEGSSTSNEPPTSPSDINIFGNSSLEANDMNIPMEESEIDSKNKKPCATHINRTESPTLGASELADPKVKFSGSLSS